MHKIYRLKDGSITRKNADGIYEDHDAPYEFVPSPSEYKFEKYRLEETGRTAADDSDEVEAAIHNTNKLDYPTYWKDTARRSQAVEKDVDITKLSGEQVLDMIETADLSTLEVLEKQELASQTRIRKSIIKAIQARREQLQPETKASAKS